MLYALLLWQPMLRYSQMEPAIEDCGSQMFQTLSGDK